MVVSKGQHVTLKTEEYCAVAEHAAEDVYRLGTDLRLWTSVVWEDNETKVCCRSAVNGLDFVPNSERESRRNSEF